MKVTVQNGAAHGLCRRDVEAIIPLLPAPWSNRVEQVVLYQGDTPILKSSFHPKEKLLGLFWPVPVESASKAQGLEELLLALSVVGERGELPARLSPAVRERHLAEVSDLLRRCLAQVTPDAA
jgi:hypothetical protein